MSPCAWIASREFRQAGSVLLRRLVYVAFFVEVGLLLIVLPWSTFWERNYFTYAWPTLRPLMTNHFVRGAISGLGVLNLLAGFAELAPVFAPRDRHDLGL
jgi:polyferredoxin